MRTLTQSRSNGPTTTTRKRGARQTTPDRPGTEPGSTTVSQRAGSKTKKPTDVLIQPIKTSIIQVEIVGTAPLVTHNFGAKARGQIRDKQAKKGGKTRHEKRQYFKEFLEACHIVRGAKLPKKELKIGESWPYKANTFGFPASGFKAASITACSFLDGVTKTTIKGAMHVLGEIVPIKFKRVTLREDVVYIGPWSNKVADLRYRPFFEEWSATLQIRFIQSHLSADQVVNLVEWAGSCVGIGEDRPEKRGGSWGTFAVKRSKG